MWINDLTIRMLILLKHDPLAQKIQSSYFCVFVFALMAAFLLRKFYFMFPHIPVESVPLIIEKNGGLNYNALLTPKPVERFVFMAVSFFVMLMLPFIILVFKNYRLPNFLSSIIESKPFKLVTILSILLTLYLPLYNSEFFGALISVYKFGSTRHLSSVTAIVLIAGYCLGYLASNYQAKRASIKPVWMLWFAFLIAVILVILAFRLYSINNVALVSPVHFDAAIYALTQVINGKTILVDLPSQYGLFPEIIAPLLRLVGSTVKSVTVLFAILQIASLCSLFYVLSKLTHKYWLLLLLGSLTLVLVTFSTPILFMHVKEPYFQYWPIRFIWPSMSILAFYHFVLNKTVARTILMSSMGAMATFWNMDSGLFIVIAFGAYLVSQLILSLSEGRNPSYWIKLTVLHIVASVLVFAGLLFYLTLKSGSSLNFYWLIHYQRTFYLMGFMALPLPYRLNPWVCILGIYLLGIIDSLYSWKQRVNPISSDTLFYVCILGIGLFTYYEGRAHPNNLIQVCWPAVVASILLTSQMLKSIELKRLSKNYFHYTALAFSFYIICSVVFMMHLRLIVKSTFEVANEAIHPTEHRTALLLNELAFIQKFAKQNSDCLILSNRSSIYYLESGHASPVKGPGLSETILQSDLDNLENQIAHNNLKCIFFGVGESETPLNINFDRILKHYKVSDKNSLGTMLYLIPKTSKLG